MLFLWFSWTGFYFLSLFKKIFFSLLFFAVCGLSLVTVPWLLIAVASLVAEWGLRASVVAAHGLGSCDMRALECTGSVALVRGLSCSSACGIFPDQGSNLCLLHWQVDSSPLSHQGSPGLLFFKWAWWFLWEWITKQSRQQIMAEWIRMLAGKWETWRKRMRWKNEKHSESRDDRLCWCGTRGKAVVDLEWILGFGLKQGDGGAINWDGKKKIWGWKKSNTPYNKFKLSIRHLNRV